MSMSQRRHSPQDLERDHRLALAAPVFERRGAADGQREVER